MLLAVLAATAHAQSKGPAAQYPDRPVRMILPFPADGAVAVWSAPDGFAAFIKAEQAKWGRVVRDANIRVE